MERQNPFPVIALGDPWHDSAYAFHDGVAMHHVEIERLTRHKYECANPLLHGCLQAPELFASARTLLFEEGRFLAPLARALLSGEALDLEEQANELIETQAGSLQLDRQTREGLVNALVGVFESVADGRTAVQIYDHHFAHAADAFLSSPFDAALVITLDGGGNHYSAGKAFSVHGSVYRMERSQPLTRKAETLVVDWSPGWAWTRASKLLGYTANEAGTVMAMAAFGEPNPKMAKLVQRRHFWNTEWPDLPRWRRHLEGRTVNGLARLLATEDDRFAFSRELQHETERRVRQFMGQYVRTGAELDLCLAGGTFLNCIIAGKIRSWFPNVRRVYIPPVPYDAGLCLGMLRTFLNDSGAAPALEKPASFSPFGMSKTYAVTDVLAAGRTHRCGDPVEQGFEAVAADIASGKIVALFQGSSESGRRALGNRSILCDPRDGDLKERMNRVIKKRQWFRPFAPMILADHVQDWFEVEEEFASPYMSFAAQFREGQGERVPAVRHVDGSARIQTVHRDLTPKTHALLTAWHSLTGIPILLNTSFNDSEPIVETPADAFSTMLRSGIDQIHFADYGLTFVNPSTLTTTSPAVR